MRPIEIHARRTVHASADDAWSLLSVYAHDPRWRRGVSAMDQTPAGPVVDGARTIEILHMLGRTMRNVAEVSDVEAGAGFSWRVVEGVDADGSRRVVALGPGLCEIVIEKRVRLERSDRLLRPVIAWVIARTERGDLRRAARLIEAGQRPVPA